MKQLQVEWEQRKLRNDVHLTTGGCLGPCELANVALLVFDGRPLWLHSFHTPEQVTALYDHIEAMVKAGSFLPAPPALQLYEFTGFAWPNTTQEDSAATLAQEATQ